jgi:hypothetical protein
MHYRTAWNDYFTGTPTVIQHKEFGTTQTPSATNVHVLNCLFRSITSSSNGGALSCDTSVTCLLVESSSFYSCKTSSGYGGAIYFTNADSGQCVFYGLCGYDCSSSIGQFSRVYMYNSISVKNYINYSSFVRCVDVSLNPLNTLSHQNGKILCPSVNISMNKCSGRSGIYTNPSADSNSVTGLFTYSTFADNHATDTICLYLERTGAKYEIKSCNILRNTQGNLGSQGTILRSGNLIIEDSCILGNNANYIFYETSSSYTITISKCTVDSTSNNGYLTIQSTVTKSFIHALNHMSTRNCHSEYDSIGTLTPIIQTSSSSKKQIQCHTCGNYIVLLRRRDIISLISILTFNFIHPHASINPFY